jgi:hypothetical protein
MKETIEKITNIIKNATEAVEKLTPLIYREGYTSFKEILTLKMTKYLRESTRHIKRRKYCCAKGVKL